MLIMMAGAAGGMTAVMALLVGIQVMFSSGVDDNGTVAGLVWLIGVAIAGAATAGCSFMFGILERKQFLPFARRSSLVLLALSVGGLLLGFFVLAGIATVAIAFTVLAVLATLGTQVTSPVDAR